MGALPRVCQSFNVGENVYQDSHSPLRLGGTVMVSQNSVCGQESVMRATALVRSGVVIVARTCESKIVPTSRFLFAGKQQSRLGKRSSRALDVALRFLD